MRKIVKGSTEKGGVELKVEATGLPDISLEQLGPLASMLKKNDAKRFVEQVTSYGVEGGCINGDITIQIKRIDNIEAWVGNSRFHFTGKPRADQT